MLKDIDSMSADELRAALKTLAPSTHTERPTGPIAPPAGLSDPTTGPASRAVLLDRFASQCMDVPQSQWTQEMKDAVRSQCQAVLARGW